MDCQHTWWNLSSVGGGANISYFSKSLLPKGIFQNVNFLRVFSLFVTSKCAIFQAGTSQVCPSRSARLLGWSRHSARPPSPSQHARFRMYNLTINVHLGSSCLGDYSFGKLHLGSCWSLGTGKSRLGKFH